MNIRHVLSGLASGRYYWWFLLSLGVLLELSALVYQYLLEYPPCVLCVHVRLWLFCLILVSVANLVIKANWYKNITGHLVSASIFIVLIERSWLLLGTERGTIVASCNFDLGLPAWFAVEKWLPFIFEVQASCGYTPELLFGITMAETLLFLSVILAMLSVVLTIVTIIDR